MTLPRVPTRLGKGILSPHSPPRRRMRHLTLSLRGLLQGLRSIDALEWRFYRMQVNLHDSLCITAVFLYCYSHRKKRNLAPSPRKYAIMILRSKKFFWGGDSPDLSPCGEGDTSLHPTPLAPRLGSIAPSALDLVPSTWTPVSAYDCKDLYTVKKASHNPRFKRAA